MPGWPACAVAMGVRRTLHVAATVLVLLYVPWAALAADTTTTATTTATTTDARFTPYCACTHDIQHIQPLPHKKVISLYTSTAVQYVNVGFGTCSNSGSILMGERRHATLASCRSECTQEPHCTGFRYEEATHRCLLDAGACIIVPLAEPGGVSVTYALGDRGRCPTGYHAFDAHTTAACVQAAAAGV